jgi:probable rRNA maturation factor
VKISVYNTQRKFSIPNAYVCKCVELILKKEGFVIDELAVHFVSKSKIASLHAEFFNDPSITDCITFPIDKPKNRKAGFLGEIFICPEVAFEYAKAHNEDPAIELTLYLVHGILHLIGYDDIKAEDIRKMRLKEKELLLFLSKKIN